MSAAAKALYDLVMPLAAATKTEHGPGVFYMAFQTQADADAFAATPTMQGGMWFFDEEKCKALCMPDAVLGAVSAGRAPAIVVLDVFQAGQRYFNDSLGTIHAETCDFRYVRLDSPPQPEDLVSNEVSEWVEHVVRISAAPDTKPGTIFHVKMAANYDMTAPYVMEVVQPEDARMEIAQMEAIMDGQVASSSMRLLLDLSAKCQQNQVVIWLRAEGETRGDVAWAISFTLDAP